MDKGDGVLSYITEKEYYEKTEQTELGHWRKSKKRWKYHQQAIDMIKTLAITNSKKVLEVGTAGIQIVSGSETMDLPNTKWDYSTNSPTFNYDMRQIPWPIKEDHYELLIALRVFQHLAPLQKECLYEALRVAKHVLLAIPETYNTKKGKGVTNEEMINWIKPTKCSLVIQPSAMKGTTLFLCKK